MGRVLGLERALTSLVLLCLGASLVSPVPANAVDGDHMITTVVDQGPIGPDGRPLDPDRVMTHPNAIAIAADGTMYVSDTGKYRIRRIDPDGVASTFAGVGWLKPTSDGIPAVEAGILPVGIAVHPSGDVYFVDRNTFQIKRIDSDGIITTIAGTGEQGSAGDGGPALDATLRTGQLAISDEGLIYYTDTYRVRVIDQNGIISAFAGTNLDGFLGEIAFSGDGGLAVSAQLRRADDIAVDKNGVVYIADTARIRRVDPNGIITTIAGTGEIGQDSAGFTGSATDVDLGSSSRITVDNNLNIYIINSRVVRRITPDGSISTIAGNGSSFADNVPASISKFEQPVSLATDKHTSLYVLEAEVGDIRKITQPDLADPVAAITSPVGGTHVDVNTAVSANFSCSDFYSGVASCTAGLNGQPINDGGQIDTSTAGVKLLTVTATDEAGNTAVSTRSITVRTPPTTTTQPTTTTTEPTTTQPTTTQPTTTTPVVTTQLSTTQPSTTQPTTTVMPTTTRPATTTPTTTTTPVSLIPGLSLAAMHDRRATPPQLHGSTLPFSDANQKPQGMPIGWINAATASHSEALPPSLSPAPSSS